MVSRYTPPGTIDAVYLANSNTGLPMGDAAVTDTIVSSFSFVPDVAATTIAEIIGVANKKYRVTRVRIDGLAGSTLGFSFSLNMRSTTTTGGTSTNQTSVSVPGFTPATGLTIRAFTANPTAGTLIGRLRRNIFTICSSGSTTYRNPDSAMWVFDGSGPVLDSTSKVLTIDMEGGTAPTRLDIVVEYVEEPTA